MRLPFVMARRFTWTLIAWTAVAVPQGGASEDATKALERSLAADEARLTQGLRDFQTASRYRLTCARQGDFDRPIKFFQERVAAEPENWRARLELACAFVDKIPACQGVAALLHRGALARQALEHMDVVVLKQPEAWVAHYARGLNHLHWPRQLGHAEDAVRDLSLCVALQEKQGGQGGNPWYLKVHIALGDAYTKAGQYAQARAAWQLGLKHFAQSKELAERLRMQTDNEQLSYVERMRSLDLPVDTDLSFLDAPPW
jgi:tetratricopeptide (TPR) repeat protein